MKLLLILVLLFITFNSNSQTIPAGSSLSFSTSSTGWSTFYINVPMVSKHSDGTIEVRGDSMTAIKLLLKEIERRDSTSEADYYKLFVEYKKCIQYLKEDQQFHKQVSSEINKVRAELKKIK